MNTVEYRKFKKLCRSCGSALDREGTYCIKCNEIMNLKRKEAVTKTHNKGLCVNCKKPLDREGWYCVKCVEYFKIWQRERIKKLSGEGLCVQCGKNVVAKSNIRCEKCLDKNRIEAKKKRWLKRTKLKIKEGGFKMDNLEDLSKTLLIMRDFYKKNYNKSIGDPELMQYWDGRLDQIDEILEEIKK